MKKAKAELEIGVIQRVVRSRASAKELRARLELADSNGQSSFEEEKGNSNPSPSRQANGSEAHSQRAIPSIQELLKRESSIPKAAPLPKVSLETLEHAIAEASRTGANVILNSPRSMEACRRAGIEAQELLPVQYNEVYHESLNLRCPNETVLKAVARKRYALRVQERESLLALVKSIRKRLIAEQEKKQSAGSNQTAETNSHSASPAPSLSRGEPSPQQNASSTPSKRRGTPVRNRLSPLAVMDRLNERLEKTLERRHQLRELEEKTALDLAAKVAQQQHQAHEHLTRAALLKQQHLYCDPTNPLTPRRQRSNSRGRKVSPTKSIDRYSTQFLAHDQTEEVRRRAQQIEMLRVTSARNTIEAREARIEQRTHREAERMSRSPSRRTASLQRSRAFSAGRQLRAERAMTRKEQLEALEEQKRQEQERALRLKEEAAIAKRCVSVEKQRESIGSRSESRMNEVLLRRQLLEEIEAEAKAELRDRSGSQLQETLTRRQQKILEESIKHHERLEMHRLRTAQCQNRAKQIELLKEMQAEMSVQGKMKAATEFHEQKAIEHLLKSAESRERAASQKRNAQRHRKAMEYMSQSPRPHPQPATGSPARQQSHRSK